MEGELKIQEIAQQYFLNVTVMYLPFINKQDPVISNELQSQTQNYSSQPSTISITPPQSSKTINTTTPKIINKIIQLKKKSPTSNPIQSSTSTKKIIIKPNETLNQKTITPTCQLKSDTNNANYDQPNLHSNDTTTIVKKRKYTLNLNKPTTTLLPSSTSTSSTSTTESGNATQTLTQQPNKLFQSAISSMNKKTKK